MRFTRTLTHFANKSWKKKTAFWGSSSLYYIYVYTNAHLMFSLGLCEKKKRQFFLFCFLLSKKKKTKHRFHGRFSSFHGSKTPSSHGRHITLLFFFPLSFYSSESKSNKKKSARLGCPPLTCVPHVSYSMRRPRFRMRSDDSSARRRSSCSSPANSIARRTRVTSSSLSVSLSWPAREPSVM